MNPFRAAYCRRSFHPRLRPLGTGTFRSSQQGNRLPHGERRRNRKSRQDRWADDRPWTLSWISMNRIDQNPGRGLGSRCRAQKKLPNATTAAKNQVISPTPRTHGVDPNSITMRPAMTTTSATNPIRRDHTAVLQCPSCCNTCGSSMPGIIPRLRVATPGSLFLPVSPSFETPLGDRWGGPSGNARHWLGTSVPVDAGGHSLVRGEAAPASPVDL